VATSSLALPRARSGRAGFFLPQRPHGRGLALPLLLAVALAWRCGQPAVPLLYVAVAGNNCVQVVDPASGRTLRRIYSGATPWRLHPAPDGRRLWVEHWGSETTAVVDLARHEIARVLPYRGPGTFSADGRRFLTFSWPSSRFDILDAGDFVQVKERVTEIPQVYDAAPDPDGKTLYLVQFDPMTRGPRPRFGYLLAYPYLEENAARAEPVSYRTGQSPAAVKVLRTGPFLLTADRETNGLTLLNRLGDGRAVPTCPAPQALVLSTDERRLLVFCWAGEGARQSQVVSYRTDFTTRPWPTIQQERTAEIDGALVAGSFAPRGDRVYAVDRTGGRVVELDPKTLEIQREIASGDLPVDLALVEVPAAVRDRLAAGGEGAARRRVREVLEKVARQGRKFASLSWTETVRWSEPAGAKSGQGRTLPVEKTRRLRSYLAPPDRLRVETEEGGIRLAAGGDTLAIERDGGFWTAPRQELAALVYALADLPVDEAVRRLAGDVPGSPYLRGGIAVDLVTEIEEQGARYVVIGAAQRGERVSQLWVDEGTFRPAKLIERFPVFARQGHGEAGFQGIVETRFVDFGQPGYGPLPARLERLLDGRFRQQIAIGDVALDRPFQDELLDLSRLGGIPRPSGLFLPAAAVAGNAPGQPGRAVPILAVADYLRSPQEPHPPYLSSPPTSGPRLPELADWGVHAIPVPLELQAHNLEHGGVALQYNCPRPCPELVRDLAAIARRHDNVLVAPYPWMDARLALSAWGWIETLDRFDERRILAFLAAHGGRDHHAAMKAASPAR
jgi:uncharacterized protein DUF3105